jgi:hypothetical protein
MSYATRSGIVPRVSVRWHRIPHSGAVVVSALLFNRLVTRTYYDYSPREALAEFRAEMAEEYGAGWSTRGAE